VAQLNGQRGSSVQREARRNSGEQWPQFTLPVRQDNEIRREDRWHLYRANINQAFFLEPLSHGGVDDYIEGDAALLCGGADLLVQFVRHEHVYFRGLRLHVDVHQRHLIEVRSFESFDHERAEVAAALHVRPQGVVERVQQAVSKADAVLRHAPSRLLRPDELLPDRHNGDKPFFRVLCHTF
jgi:hypothetical protein